MRLIQKGGNDVVMTPPYLAQAIVDHFKPAGTALEPCKGTGSFVEALKNSDCFEIDWMEISKGKDFLTGPYGHRHYGWIVTNPPRSQFRAFLQKSMKLADNVVFLSSVNAWWYTGRQRDIAEAGFGMVEIAKINEQPPKPWPQAGLQLAAAWIRRGWTGSCTISELKS